MAQTPEQFMAALSALCERHGASLFFGNGPAQLWIHGAHVGALQEIEGGGGDTFEALPADSDGAAEEAT